MLVATHLDQRDADLPLAELRRRYPQLAGHWAVGNKTGEGIEAMRVALREEAAGLPLMAELWPADWLEAAEAVREREERLPLDPPEDLEGKWEAAREVEPCQEITMRYRLNTIPAGIPTWFIARAHRFTTHTHWRNGALFAYSPERRHVALARALAHERCLELCGRGRHRRTFSRC